MIIEKKFVFSKEDGEAVEKVIDLIEQLTEDGGVHRIVSTSNCPGAHEEIKLDDLWNTLSELLVCIEIQGANYLFEEE